MTEMSLEEVDRLMNDARIGRLCMADGEGRPYVIPLPFCWDEGAVYVRVALTGRKGEVLRESNLVCFEVDYFSESLEEYGSVLVEAGEAPAERKFARKTRLGGSLALPLTTEVPGAIAANAGGA